MSIKIDLILDEIKSLPEYDDQLSLQVTKEGSGGEGQLAKLDFKEEDFNVFAYDLPYTNSVLSDLKMYRSRLMNMPPKYCYSYHKDKSKRIHVPITTNSDCWIIVEKNIHHLPANGSHYIVDTTKMHTAVNASAEDRIHILGNIE